MNNQVKIETKPNENGETIVHMLTGELPEPINFKSMELSGNIFAVEKYVIGKNLRGIDKPAKKTDDSPEMKTSVEAVLDTTEIDVFAQDVVIMIDDEANSILLEIYKQHPHGIKVTAQLTKTDVFRKFGIEDGKRFTITELKQLIRVHRPYFSDKDQHTKLLTNLGRTDLNVQQIIKEHNDDRGNINSLLEQKVTSNVDERFTLEIPIYKGMPSVKFEVNVLMDVRDKGVSIWLESVEALELMKDMWEKERDRQIEFFETRAFTVITK